MKRVAASYSRALSGEVDAQDDRNAMAAEAGAGMGVREWLALGIDHFPDVDAHLVEDDLELVNKCNIDRANIL